MIYKLLGWGFLITFVVYNLNIEQKNKEEYKNKELKDHGVGTFHVFNTQGNKNRDDEEDYSLYDKKTVQQKIDSLKKTREAKFNEYVSLKQTNGESEYTKNLEKNIDTIDEYINKLEKIYYKISFSKATTEGNDIPKYDKKYDETLFKFPMGNLLPVSDNRNVFENRIHSFNTDILMVDKGKISNELDNKVFDDEFENMINEQNKNYYNKLLDYEKVYDDDNDYQNTNEKEPDTEEKGLFRKKKYENVNDKDIDLFDKVQQKVLKQINQNSNIGSEDNTFKIVQKKLNYILYNKNNIKEVVYDGEIVIYRALKNHGKHIGFKVFIRNNSMYIVGLKMKGIVTEDKIYMLISSNEFENNLVYYEYGDKYIMTSNPRENEVNDMSYIQKVMIMRNRKNALRLDRGLV